MKHFAERAGVLVADRPSDLLDRLIGEFEHLSCLADAQALAILGWLETRRLVKTSQEGALFEAAQLCHLFDRRHIWRMILQPMLHFKNSGVAVVQLGCKVAVVALLAAWRIDEHVARSFDHYGRAEITIDELEPKIGPREHTTGRNEISVLNGNTAFIHVNVGKTFRQLHGEVPMRGGRTS